MIEPIPGLALPTKVEAATRIYIDHDEAGTYVYRLVEAATGQIVAELPRDARPSLTGPDGHAAGLAAA